MDYYFNKTIDCTMDMAIQKVTQALASEGFGVLTSVDIRDTLKKKLNVDFHNYIILGACNPALAYRALQAEDKVGTMLPCNIILQEKSPGKVEVSAIDPVASIQFAENVQLEEVAGEVSFKLRKVMIKL